MFVPGQLDAMGSLVGFKFWAPQIKGTAELLADINSSLHLLWQLPPRFTHSWLLLLLKILDMNMAAIVAPDDKKLLLAEEEQAQREANDLRQALEDMQCKHNGLVVKCHKAQATQEKHKVAQHEVDTKVRGHMLANAAMAEVWQQAMCQAEKARKAAEKLCLE